jgi:hypothetical protein
MRGFADTWQHATDFQEFPGHLWMHPEEQMVPEEDSQAGLIQEHSCAFVFVSEWYVKSTGTWLNMNFHVFAAQKVDQKVDWCSITFLIR